jgi:putative heme transporter
LQVLSSILENMTLPVIAAGDQTSGAETALVGAAQAQPSRSSAHRILGRGVLLVATITACALIVGKLAHVPWAGVATTLINIPGIWVIGLLLLWAAGLAAHTITLTAAMPGLSHRRAATMSLTGSFVANVLPLGGAAGVALNTAMARRWGFSGRDIAVYTLVTNVWDVLAKLLVGIVASVLLVRHGIAVAGLMPVTVSAVLLLLVACAVLASDRVARVMAAGLRFSIRWLSPERAHAWSAALLRTRRTAAATARERWHELSIGMFGYTSLLFLLLWACLAVVGVHLPFVAVLAAFAVERLLTMAALTPGGVGPVELGLGTVLIAEGTNPVGVAAAVLLYRLLTFGLEIPVGGIWCAGWFAAAGRARARELEVAL